MVPTLLLLGLVLGRWWRTTLLIAVLGWPLLLLATGTIEAGWAIAGAAGIAVVNTGIGVLAHQAVRWLLRRLPAACPLVAGLTRRGRAGCPPPDRSSPG